MRNLKKFLALVLAMMMAFSLMTTVSASSFKDADDINDAYTDAVNVLTTLGVINGYKNGDVVTFDPKANITRGEVAAIVYRIATGDVAGDNIHLYENYSEFDDVAPSGVWYTPYINYCYNNGLIKGVGGGKFAPKNNVTGYEALVMILRTMGYNDPTEFSSSDWKLKASGYGRRLGITTNIPEGSLGTAATREMVAEIMYKAIQAPTVSYSNLYGYSSNVLVRAGTTGVSQDSGAGSGTLNDDAESAVVYTKDVFSTLLFEVFDVVDMGEGRDNYGRPTITLLGDGKYDNVIHGTKYVAGGTAANKTWTVEDPNKAGTAADFRDDVIGDPVLYTVTRTPVHTFYTAVSECELTKIINNDKSISWSYIDEYVNGNHITGRTGTLDATHTTVNTIGAQGRTTEIFKVGSYWTFVYYDTLMGKVTAVTPVQKDTAGHIMKQATLTVLVNNGANGDKSTSAGDTTHSSVAESNANVSVTFSADSNYDYSVDDLVLLTTYGMKDAAANSGNINGASTGITLVDRLAVTTLQDGYMTGAAATGALASASVPNVLADFKVETPKINASTGAYDTPNNDFAVDLVGAPTEKTVTVTATVGNAELKTGIKAGDDTYMANNTYLKAAAMDDYWVKDAATDLRSLTNSKIGRTFTLYLDKHDNILGMVEGITKNVGVITSAEPVRIGTGKWALEIEVFLEDESSKSFRLLDDTTTPGSYLYYEKESDVNDGYGTDNSKVMKGDLVKLSAITKDGQTYWTVADCDTTAIASAQTSKDTQGVTGTSFSTGLTNTLDNGTANTKAKGLVNDDTIFFVTEYDFHYNTGSLDAGNNTEPTYRVYKGFKNVPTFSGANAGDVIYQIMSKTDKGDVDYILIGSKSTTTATYTQTKKNTIAVDDSILIVAPIATYADYAEYSVIRNGKQDTLKVSNGNAALNGAIETARNANKLIYILSENSRGYVTAIADIDTIAASNGTGYDATLYAQSGVNTFAYSGTTKTATIKGGTGASIDNTNCPKVTYSKGVLTINLNNVENWLTVADDCVVKIVNKDLNTMYDGTLDSIELYHPEGPTTGSATFVSDDIVIEFNNLGYASAIYIMD